jgi:hypothetical protein
MTDDPLRLLGLKDVAALLGTHWHNVRDLVDAGDLPCVRVGASGEPKVARVSLEAWLRALGEQAAARSASRLTGLRAGTRPAPLRLRKRTPGDPR